MMERLGRLTFPNGRTGAPVIDDDLVIVRGITSNWGRQGPARDRFYAFDKITGELVWSSTPGVGPRDSSFSTPVFAWEKGRRVFYCGTGCGNIVCVDARTGEPVWRYQFLTGGVNSSVLLHDNNKIIVIHGKENIDSSKIGRMVAIDTGWYKGKEEPVVLDRTSERWRTDLAMFTSSATLVGDRVYQVVHTGELYCLDANTGKTLWRKKLSNSQLHASPLYADGKLYIPLRNGLFYILKPSDLGVEVLSKVQLAGNALGSPSVWNGKIYVHTTEQLYCFGKAGDNPHTPKYIPPSRPAVDPKPTRLQIVPSEVLLRPGQHQSFKVRQLNNQGQLVSGLPSTQATWEKFIPATAKVRVKMDGDFNEQAVLVIGSANRPSAGAYKATAGNLSGTFRGRVLPKLPFGEDFESFELTVPHATDKGVLFSYPPLPWIGARFKWEVRSVEGNKLLIKTLDRVLFQRALTFIGHPDLKNYRVQLDIMTDGNRRIMSTAGAINQRYIIILDGNKQVLEVSSNHSLLKVSTPFDWKPKIWYRLLTQVDVADDGSGIVRAKAWRRDGPEPDAWTIEVPHRRAHVKGAPGIFGFSPQSQFHVYVDNISVTPNEN
ncbi:MAG: PQQ-binding-like beta-propeller repeat protein [Planctomycetes bacterium]|nr:PQQ-binding-like beta-propeller repeat protein [Planctomycetota bacterium]